MKALPKSGDAAPKVAVIDSGINARHSHVRKIAGGIGFYQSTAGSIRTDDNLSDEIGHGTAIAGVMRQYAPAARLYAVKIFNQRLSATAALLMTALKWAIHEKMNIIHLSLGTTASGPRRQLTSLCRWACDQGGIVLAAARAPDDAIYPASLDSVIGVYAHPHCAKDEMVYHTHGPIDFGACGRPRSLGGLPADCNFKGGSFAVAHVTGQTARLLSAQPRMRWPAIRQSLADLAVQKPPAGDHRPAQG